MATSASDQLERYRMLEPLGAGGQGRTYRALDTRTGAAVAVKVIRIDQGWKAFDLFEREAQVLRSLHHPAIPKYVDTFALPEEGRYFLVMELVEGRPLREMVERGELLGKAQLSRFLDEALAVLEYLHGLHPPVIHRDLKPANLILRSDGTLALVDFGGVRVALRPEGGSTIIGSFGYMAPEQLHGEATPATDLYGLGATLAALAAGMDADKLPRRGLRVDLAAVMAHSPLRDLLARMLEPDPRERPASVAEVRLLLRGDAAAGSLPLDADGAPDRAADLLVRFFGSLGYVGLVLAEAIVLPLVYFIFSQVWSRNPGRLRWLEGRRDVARGALRDGRRSMKQLTRSSRVRGQLPPGRGPGPAHRPGRQERRALRAARREQRRRDRGRS